MNEQQLKNVVEGALLAAGRSLSLDALQELFLEDGRPDKGQLRRALEALTEDYAGRSIEIKETASGYRIQVRQEYAEWISRLWEERPTRYSRALLETLALVAYRQPITRGEIEEVRGVSVSTSIMRTLQERDWVRVVGHRDVPGRPAMYGTTKTFLDYFGLKSLDELPTLSELRDIDSINVELDLREKGGDEARTAGLHASPNAQAGDSENGDHNDDVENVADETVRDDVPDAEDLDADVAVDDESLGVGVAMAGDADADNEDTTVEVTEEPTVDDDSADADESVADDMTGEGPGEGDASQEQERTEEDGTGEGTESGPETDEPRH